MTADKKPERIDKLRRRILKSSALAGGALVASRLPYTSPEVKSFTGASAYAQMTTFTIACSAEPSEMGSGGPGTICDDAQLTNITAVVSPIPPVGTQLQCEATTDDPMNPSVPADTATTDATGTANFPFSLDLNNFPNPPIANGSTLTITITFIDQATYGMASCVENWTVEACP